MKNRLLLYFLFFLVCVQYAMGQQPSLKWLNTYGSSLDPVASRFEYGTSGMVHTTDDAFYSAGRVCDTIDFDPGPGSLLFIADTPKHCNSYIGKFTKKGLPVWIKKWHQELSITQISGAPDGDLLVCGTYWQTLNLALDSTHSETLSYESGNINAFVLRMDTVGKIRWVKTFNALDISLAAQAHDSSVYIIGNYRGTMDADPGAQINLISSSGIYGNSILLRLTENGDFRWVNEWYATSSASITGLSFNSKGNMITGLNYNGFIDVDPGAGVLNKSSIGLFDFALLTMEPQSGGLTGSTFWSGKDNGTVSSVRVLEADEMVLLGQFKDSLDVDPGAGATHLLGFQPYNVFVMKLDSAFSLKWAGQYGGAYVAPSHFSISHDQQIVTGGKFSYDMDMDPDTSVWMLNNTKQFTTYIQTLDANGKLKSVFTLDNATLSNIGFTSRNSLVLTGSFKLNVAFNPDSANKLTAVKGENDLFMAMYTNCKPQTHLQTIHACPSYTFNGTTFYKDTLLLYTTETALECDSTIQVDLRIALPDTAVNLAGATLTSQASGVSYQWIDCNTQLPLANQTAKTFTPVKTGSYAVIITRDACVDTSACYQVTYTGAEEIDMFMRLSVYPNPVTNYMFISGRQLFSKLEFEVLDACGKKVLSGVVPEDGRITLGDALSKGLYFLKLNGAKQGNDVQVGVSRFIKE